MKIHNLKIQNFRNHKAKEFAFKEGFNVVVGNNGAGKTSLLEAVAYLMLSKSFLTSSEKSMVNISSDYFTLEGDVHHSRAKVAFQKGKKQFFLDEEKISKISDYYGQFYVVWVAPNDLNLVEGLGEIRRKFMDRNIALVSKDFLIDLVRYHKILAQRNRYLKNLYSTKPDTYLLDIYDTELIALAKNIAQFRSIFIQEILPLFQANYQEIAGVYEKVDIYYETRVLEDDFEHKFMSNRSADILGKRTLMGIHKDDLKFLTLGMNTKSHASQGQIKNFVVALKCAVFQWFEKKTKQTPVLLIDDMNDRLDLDRLRNFIHFLSKIKDAQIIISDTRASTLNSIFEELNLHNNCIQL